MEIQIIYTISVRTPNGRVLPDTVLCYSNETVNSLKCYLLAYCFRRKLAESSPDIYDMANIKLAYENLDVNSRIHVLPRYNKHYIPSITEIIEDELILVKDLRTLDGNIHPLVIVNRNSEYHEQACVNINGRQGWLTHKHIGNFNFCLYNSGCSYPSCYGWDCCGRSGLLAVGCSISRCFGGPADLHLDCVYCTSRTVLDNHFSENSFFSTKTIIPPLGRRSAEPELNERLSI